MKSDLTFGFVHLIHEDCHFNRIIAIFYPLKKRIKNGARGCDRVEIYREIVPGIELAARHQRTHERAFLPESEPTTYC